MGRFALVAIAALAAESAVLAADPVLRSASSDDVVQAVGNCMQAVGPNRAVNMSRLDEAGWVRLPNIQSAESDVIGRFSRGDVVNEVSFLPRAAGCRTRAKLEKTSQIGEIRSAMIAKLGLAGFDEFQGKAGFKAAMVQQFGDSVRDKLLFKAGNSFTIESTEDGTGSLIVITNITDAAPSAPAAN